MNITSTKNLLLKSRVGRALSGAAAIGSVAAVVAASSVMPTAAAPTPGTLVANGVTSPTGILWLPGNLGGHFWVADHAQGLCRVDGAPGSATLTNCDLTAKSVGQPAYDPVTHSVYVPDNSAKSQGVWRLTFDPVTETMGGGGGGGVFGGGSSTAPVLLAPNKGLGGNKPFAVATDPNDNYALYIGFKKTPNILRIRNASVGTGDAPVTIGNSSDGRETLAMTVLSHNGVSALIEADGRGVAAITNPAACTGSCGARSLGLVTIPAPLTVSSPTVAPGAENSVAYIGDAANVYAYDAVAGQLTTLSTGFANASAIGVRLNGGAAPTIWAGDDPTLGASVGAGHLYQIQ